MVLVTGASSGIGRATALAFAGEGARIAIGYHANAGRAAEVAEVAEAAVASGTGAAVPWYLDLADPGVGRRGRVGT